MKTVKYVLMIGLMATVATVYGQSTNEQNHERRQNREFRGRAPMKLDLSEEQQSKAEELRFNMQKDALPIRNQLGENKAKLRTLTTAEDVDMKAVNKLIDANAELQADLAKLRAANHQEFRNLLTEEQRVKFDSRSHQMRGDRQFQRGEKGQRGQKRQERQHQGEL